MRTGAPLPLPASGWTLKFSSGRELGMCQLGNYFNDFVSKLNSVGQTKGENMKRVNKNVQFGSERMWGAEILLFCA